MEDGEDRGTRSLGVLGRLAPDASLKRAQAELDAVSARPHREHSDHHEDRGAGVVSFRERLLDDSRESSLLLFGAMALVWPVACVHVANLLLTRGALRDREMAVRAALGAGRSRLVRQVLTESVVLAFLGPGPGLAIAAGGLRLIATLSPVPRRGRSRPGAETGGRGRPAPCRTGAALRRSPEVFCAWQSPCFPEDPQAKESP